jgi:DNA-binding Lrp family transcriptional regulator
MIPEDERSIVAHLRQDARLKLTGLARVTGIPVTTLFHRLKNPSGLCITRFTALLDFERLGYPTRATILLKAGKEMRGQLQAHLLASSAVNCLVRINNGYDFLAECAFKGMQELDRFCEILETQYSVRCKELHFTVEELKREGFLADPGLLKEVE